MSVLYILIFILIDMCSLLISYKLFDKFGLISMYVLHIILSQITINIPLDLMGLTTVVGSSVYAVLFLTIDMINEHYGEKVANKTVNVGVFILIIFILIISFIKILIADNNDIYSTIFNQLFENQLRVVASDIVISYFLFQKLNIWIFNKVKKITNSKYLWLRNNLSTIVSQLLTAIFFYQAAFAGVVPQKELWQIIITGLIIKLIITMFETPFLYLSCKIKNNNS